MKAGYIDTLDVDAVRDDLVRWHESRSPVEQKENDEIILEAKDMHFQYTSRRKILQDINFKIRKGEMVSIVGTNGAGKSTLAKVICGFVKEDQGGLYFEGEPMKDWTIKERSHKIGYVITVSTDNRQLGQTSSNFILNLYRYPLTHCPRPPLQCSVQPSFQELSAPVPRHIPYSTDKHSRGQ